MGPSSIEDNHRNPSKCSPKKAILRLKWENVRKLLCTLERALLYTSSVKNRGQICPLSPNLRSSSSLPPTFNIQHLLGHSVYLTHPLYPTKLFSPFITKKRGSRGGQRKERRNPGFGVQQIQAGIPMSIFIHIKNGNTCLILRTYHLFSKLNDSKKAMVPDKYSFTAVVMMKVVAWRQT